MKIKCSLGIYILASAKYEIVFRCPFISKDKGLKKRIEGPRMSGVERHGGSFWIKLT